MIRLSHKYATGLLVAVVLFLGSGAADAAPCMKPPGQRTGLVLRKVSLLQEENKTDEAIAFLEKVVGPTSRGHYLVPYLLGNLYAEKEQPEKAFKMYNASIARCPEFHGSHQNLGRVAWELKKYDVAADALVKAFELSGEKHPDLLFNAAVVRVTSGGKKEALALLDRLFGAFEPRLKWMKTYVGICMELNRPEKALTAMEAHKGKLKECPQFWRLKGIIHVRQNQYGDAASAFKVYACLKPDLPASDRELLGDLYMNTGVPLAAATQYETVGKKDLALYRKTASAYLSAFRPEESLKVLDQALQRFKDADLYFLKGRICFEEGRYQEAYDSFDECTRLAAKKGKAHLLKGYCALKLGEKTAARKALKAAAACPREKKEANRMLGWIERASANQVPSEDNAG